MSKLNINVPGPAKNLAIDLLTFEAVDSLRARKLDLDDLYVNLGGLALYWYLGFAGQKWVEAELDDLIKHIKQPDISGALVNVTRPMSEFTVRSVCFYGAHYLMKERISLRKLITDQAYYQAAREIQLMLRQPRGEVIYGPGTENPKVTVPQATNLMARKY